MSYEGWEGFEEGDGGQYYDAELPEELNYHFSTLKNQVYELHQWQDVSHIEAQIAALEQEVKRILGSYNRRENEDEEEEEEEVAVNYVAEDVQPQPSAATNTTSFRKEIARRLEGFTIFGNRDKEKTVSVAIKQAPVPAAPQKRDFTQPETLEKIIKLQKLARRHLYYKRWRKLVAQYKSSEQSIKSRRRFEKEKELIQTEKSYVASLQILVSKFLNPLNKAVQTAELHEITLENVNTIFSNISVLYSVNTTFLKEVEAQYSQYPLIPFQLGAIFLRMIPFFKTYTLYVNSYENAIATLGYCRSKKQFNAWLKKAEFAAGKLDIGSYLIMPVQRIPRYNLLLQDLISLTEEYHKDYPHLCEALQKTKELAEHINQQKKNAENLEKVLKLQNNMSGLNGKCLVARNRLFVREGILKVSFPSGYSMGQASVILFSDSVLIAKYSNYKKKYKFEGVIALRDATVEDVVSTKTKNAFKIVYRRQKVELREILLCAIDEEDKANWMRDISKLIADVVNIDANKMELYQTTKLPSGVKLSLSDANPPARADSSHSKEYIKSGSFHLVVPGAISRRVRYWFALRSDGYLSYYEQKNKAVPVNHETAAPIYTCNLQEFELRKLASNSTFQIQLYNPKKSVEIAFPSREILDDWINELKKLSANSSSPRASAPLAMPSVPPLAASASSPALMAKLNQPQHASLPPQPHPLLPHRPPPPQPTAPPVLPPPLFPHLAVEPPPLPPPPEIPQRVAQPQLPNQFPPPISPRNLPQQPKPSLPPQRPPPKLPPPVEPATPKFDSSAPVVPVTRGRSATQPARPLPTPPTPLAYDICAPMRLNHG